jgi:hypothetical protein
MSNNSICSLNQNKFNCLPNESLQIISEIVIPEQNKDNLNNTDLIETLSNQLQCNTKHSIQEKELCVLQKLKKDNTNNELGDAIEKQIIKYYKPKVSRLDGNYWLNNTEIDNIQFQLQTKFNGYYYSYIHMIDLIMFEPQNKNILLNNKKIYNIKDINFIDELKNLNNKLTYNNKLKYYGIVCNTDLSTNSGIHWFSIFIDFTKDPITIEYFNSSGYSLLKGSHMREREEFLKFFLNLADELSNKIRHAKFIQVTNIEHQRSDTANCGSYSLYYIWSRLNGIPYTKFKDTKITDEMMEEFRKVLWRKE